MEALIMNDKTEHDADAPLGLLTMLKQQLGTAMIAGAGIGLLYGGLVGLGVVLLRETLSIPALLVCLVCIGGGVPILVYAYRRSPSLRDGDPDTPRARRMGKLMFFLMTFVVVIMLPFVIRGDSLEGIEFWSNGPIPQWIALFLGAVWLIGMPALVYFNRVNMDELERGEMEFGETIGFQFFGLGAPLWWIAHRGGFAPEPDLMIMFVATVAVSVAANMYRKVS
ncbi:hypothetical protein NAP1_05100 [Erythrobacter sp. NAP1]|nr:hypothetical protein NAP1_05100 [Erythrobacter sp. NAP1]